MQLTISKLKQIVADFPLLTFQESDAFKWLPKERTIHYVANELYAAEHLLHELAHAELQHSDYTDDVTLLSMEREAWQYAVAHLASRYEVAIDDELIQDDLDSYRDWLHARSTCPNCTANGIQTDSAAYTCIVCHHSWKVNEAIHTRLQRRSL